MASDLRVVSFINGIPFYPQSVTFTATRGATPSFTLTVPAVPQWDLLPERSHCVVFFIDPVTRTWRFLYEGEYDKTHRGRLSTGARSRTLCFRSLFGYWDQADFTTLSGCAAKPSGQPDLVYETVIARAAGQNLTFKDNGGPPQLDNLQAIIEQVIAAADKDKAQTLSGAFPAFVKRATIQTPVEAFYADKRKVLDKFSTEPDSEVTTVMTFARFRDCLTNQFNPVMGKPNTKLSELLAAYENMAFYQHTPLPAGFVNDAGKLVELQFIPQLYGVLPPACNVIFSDQIVSSQINLDILHQPTRVVTEVTFPFAPNGNAGLPIIYMANDATTLNVTAQKANEAVTHDALSPTELLRGVVATSVSIGFEKLVKTDTQDLTADSTAPKNDELTTLIEEAVKYQYTIERARYMVAELSCSFLPYVVPGYPCLVEDSSGSYHGMLESVTHMIPCTGVPSTSLSVSTLRPAYVEKGTNNSPPLPRWLSKIFRPEQVMGTYKKTLGTATDFAETVATEGAPNEVAQANLDILASNVISTPTYDAELNLESDPYDLAIVANQLRNEVDTQSAMLQYQYRQGTSISEYASFHGLNITGIDDGNMADEFTAPLTGNNDLFGSPAGLRFVGKGETGSNIYGVYQLVGGVSDYRAVRTQAVLAAISRGVSPD